MSRWSQVDNRVSSPSVAHCGKLCSKEQRKLFNSIDTNGVVRCSHSSLLKVDMRWVPQNSLSREQKTSPSDLSRYSAGHVNRRFQAAIMCATHHFLISFDSVYSRYAMSLGLHLPLEYNFAHLTSPPIIQPSELQIKVSRQKRHIGRTAEQVHFNKYYEIRYFMRSLCCRGQFWRHFRARKHVEVAVRM